MNIHRCADRRALPFATVLLSASSAMLFCVSTVFAPQARAQAVISESQLMTLSAFGGATGTLTGLYSNGYYNSSGANGPVQGKNLGITAGVDLRISQFHQFNPTVEVRGTFPTYTGDVDSMKAAFAGLKVDRSVGTSGRIHPYVDFFFGRGEIDYHSGGYLTDGRIYYATNSNVLSPGAGVDLGLTHHFGVKFDAQYQHYNTPATNSGKIWAMPVTVAMIYVFDFNRHGGLIVRRR